MAGFSKTAGEVVVEVKMLRAARPEATFLVVEGPTDKRFWAARVSEACQIILATCKSVGKSAIYALNGKVFAGYVGIFDRDFDDLWSDSLVASNILFWDAYSYETEIYQSDSIDRLLSELGDHDKCAAFRRAGKDPRQVIWALALQIGRVRLLGFLKGQVFPGDELSPHRFVNEQTLALDTAALEAKAVELGIAASVLQLAAELRNLPPVGEKRVVRGHDLVSTVAIALRRVLGARGAPSQIESQLRTGFDGNDLARTTVYAQLREWEARNRPFAVLP